MAGPPLAWPERGRCSLGLSSLGDPRRVAGGPVLTLETPLCVLTPRRSPNSGCLCLGKVVAAGARRLPEGLSTWSLKKPRGRWAPLGPGGLSVPFQSRAGPRGQPLHRQTIPPLPERGHGLASLVFARLLSSRARLKPFVSEPLQSPAFPSGSTNVGKVAHISLFLRRTFGMQSACICRWPPPFFSGFS